MSRAMSTTKMCPPTMRPLTTSPITPSTTQATLIISSISELKRALEISILM